MDLFRMKCIVSVYEHGTLTRAAEAMHITQPAMSVQMKSLEKEIGVKLFERDSNRIRLTPAGEILSAGFQNILGRYDSLLAQVRTVANADSASLRVGYHGPSDYTQLGGLLQHYMLRCPDVQIDLTVKEFGDLANDLMDRKLDVIFTEQAEMADRPELEWIPLYSEYSCVALAATHPLAGRPLLTPGDLEGEQIVMNGRPSPAMNAICSRLASAGFDMENARIVNQNEISVAMAAAGMGITPLPRSFRISGHPAIKYVDIDSEKLHVDHVLAWRRDENGKASLRAFARMCEAWDWPREQGVLAGPSDKD